MRFDSTTGIFRVYEGGGKGAPPPPDYAGAAVAQGNSNKEVNRDQTWANRPTINTPWGTQSWKAGSTTDPASGAAVTNWTQENSLTPESQAALDSQMRIGAAKSKTAEGLLGQVADATSSPFDWEGLPERGGDIKTAQNDAFSRYSQALQPGRSQQSAALDNRLQNSGLPINSEAYNRANMSLQNQFGQQDRSMLAQADQAGIAGVAAQTMQRQTAIAEEAQRRGMSLNELNALLTGSQVSMPQGFGAAPSSTAGAAAATPYMNSAIAQGQAATAAGGNDWGSAIGGIGSIASAASKFSDRRLKSNIVRVGTHKRGIGIYEYTIFGAREFGVMAQELLGVAPELVSVHPSGFFMVNYAGL